MDPSGYTHLLTRRLESEELYYCINKREWHCSHWSLHVFYVHLCNLHDAFEIWRVSLYYIRVHACLAGRIQRRWQSRWLSRFLPINDNNYLGRLMTRRLPSQDSQTDNSRLTESQKIFIECDSHVRRGPPAAVSVFLRPLKLTSSWPVSCDLHWSCFGCWNFKIARKLIRIDECFKFLPYFHLLDAVIGLGGDPAGINVFIIIYGSASRIVSIHRYSDPHSDMMQWTTPTLVLALACSALAAPNSRASTVNLPGAAKAVPYGTKKVETPWTSSSVDTFVANSVVSLYLPLGKSYPAHSLECDYVVSRVLNFCYLDFDLTRFSSELSALQTCWWANRSHESQPHSDLPTWNIGGSILLRSNGVRFIYPICSFHNLILRHVAAT